MSSHPVSPGTSCLQVCLSCPPACRLGFPAPFLACICVLQVEKKRKHQCSRPQPVWPLLLWEGRFHSRTGLNIYFLRNVCDSSTPGHSSCGSWSLSLKQRLPGSIYSSVYTGSLLRRSLDTGYWVNGELTLNSVLFNQTGRNLPWILRLKQKKGSTLLPRHPTHDGRHRAKQTHRKQERDIEVWEVIGMALNSYLTGSNRDNIKVCFLE